MYARQDAAEDVPRQQTGSPEGRSTAASLPLRLLAYVHLRNIHASTGAGRTARQIVEHLAAMPAIDLHVLADSNDARKILPLVGAPWTGYNFATFDADTTQQQMRWFFLNRPRAEQFWPEAEVVYCTAESYVPVTRARLAVTAHDAGYFETNAHLRDSNYWKTRLKWKLLFNKLERKVDLFHTVSAFSAERLAHFFPAIRSRIQWVHNGVTAHFFEPTTPEGWAYLQEAGLHDRPYVLVPGGLHFRKNAELILEAAPALLQAFPDLTIAVVNHTNPAYAERSKALGARFRCLGFVSDAALQALYSQARVVWYPSRYEGFGLPVVEAMACGAPVVASNAASIPEVAGDAALLADPHSAAKHVEAITGLLTDDRAREALSQAGRAHAQQFTWDRCARQLSQHLVALR